MRIIFDCDQLSSPIYGVGYAVLEQLKALQTNSVFLKNFVVGRKNLNEHQSIMKKNGFQSVCIKFPKKMQGLLNTNNLLGKYDYFYQIGVHALRNIPAEKYIVALHDTVSLRYPQSEGKMPKFTQKLLSRAAKIITVSNFSKSEIIKYFKLDPNKIQVIYNGCNFQRFNLKIDQLLFNKLKNIYKLPKDYCLAYGGNTPRKNLERLCRVFEKLELPLVIFGGYKYSGNKNNIYCLGYLPEKEVEEIVKGAKLFLMPSYYEGFGLPILEAMACGIPVACSNNSSLPEISGGNAVYFDPFDEKDILKKIKSLYINKNKLKTLRLAGLKWVKKFTWDNSAKAFLKGLK